MGGFGGIIGGVAGAALGFMVGGPVGAQMGWLAGSMLGNLLDPPKIEAPEPQMQKLQQSAYGRPIPIVYGTDRLAGTVIWLKWPYDKHKETSGGKGGPEVTTTTFSTSLAVLICANPITSVLKVFADGRLVWDGDDTEEVSFTLYTGTETQLPDPTMEAELGVGNVPAYRGYTYVVFTDLALKQFGERVPNFEFVVSTPDEQAIPIERIAQNYDQPTGFGAPAITTWTRAGSRVVVVDTYEDATTWNLLRSPSMSPYRGAAYNRELVGTGVGVGEGTVPLPFRLCNEPPLAKGDEYFMFPVGMYRPSTLSDAAIPLWVRWTRESNDYPTAHGIATDAPGGVSWPMLVSGDVISYLPTGNANVNIPFGTEYANKWGVPAGGFIAAAALTQDRTRLFLFTAATKNGSATDWYEIIDGAIARQGTVNPSVGGNQWFYGGAMSAEVGPAGAGQFENNKSNNWRKCCVIWINC
jgi:hypothetical protein